MIRPILIFTLALGLAAALPGATGTAAANSYVVQLASLNSERSANDAWSRMQRKHPNLLGDLTMSVQKADLGSRGIFYRLQTGPFPNRATAEDMCLQLRSQRLDCLVVKR